MKNSFYIICSFIVTFISCNESIKSEQKNINYSIEKKTSINNKETICDSLFLFRDSIYNFKLYQELYSINRNCAKKYALITKRNESLLNEMDYITCDTLKLINFKKLNKRKIELLYTDLLKNKNDNCILEYIDRLREIDSVNKNSFFVDLIKYRFDGYVSDYYEATSIR